MQQLPDPSQQPNQPAPPRFSWWWLILLAALAAWNVIAFWPSVSQQIEIPYSDLIAQIKADNVTSIRIDGATLSGQFRQAIPDPQAALTPTPAASPNPSSNSSSAATTAPATYTAFISNFPDTVGDPSLMPLLQDHNVQITALPAHVPWFTLLLTDGLPILLMVLVIVWIGRQATRGQSGILSFGKSKPQITIGERPEVTFDDVAGEDEAKQELREVVDFLRNPEKYHDVGARIPRGVLLVGPPGTGKTLLARAVAGEAGVPFYNISASEFVEMFVGVGASRVRDLFDKAKATSPAIVFIDELDAVGRRRGSGLGAVNDEREQTLNQLLVEMDGFDERHEVIIIAATNRPDVLDPALLRPGRFDREVVVGLPDMRGRVGILQIHTRELQLAADVNLTTIAQSTPGLSGADLANLCNEAALTAARHDRDRIAMGDFEEAQDRIVLGETRSILLDENERRVIATHEAGHAVVAWLLAEADPVHKVTIIPRGQALGVTEQLPGKDKYNYSLSYLMARLAVMLGGRTAEELVLGDITTGAENDLVEATRLARRMVTRWGMGSLGLIAFAADEQQPFLGYELTQGRDYSEATAARIDDDVRQLLADRHVFVRDLLTEHRDQLDALAENLLTHETIGGDAMRDLLGEPVERESLEAEPVL